MRMPAQCGIPSSANERGCNGICYRLRNQTPRLEGASATWTRGEVSAGGTIDTDEKKLADVTRKDGEGQQTRVESVATLLALDGFFPAGLERKGAGEGEGVAPSKA
jgi:hypothetical protein